MYKLLCVLSTSVPYLVLTQLVVSVCRITGQVSWVGHCTFDAQVFYFVWGNCLVATGFLMSTFFKNVRTAVVVGYLYTIGTGDR
jgi:hypothetical protein